MGGHFPFFYVLNKGQVVVKKSADAMAENREDE
jgi:hypothetical protein